MAAEGFQNTFEVNMDDMLDKTMHTFRKSKTNTLANHWKWNPFNLVNKHYTRQSDQLLDLMVEQSIPKRIYQARPNLVLNIGNEYLTMNLMEELASYYKNTALTMPKRHIYTRFVRDFKEFTLPMIDYAHFTNPLQTGNDNGFVFPGEYVGQYGTYEAVKHIYSQNESMKGLDKGDHILVNKRYFASDMEKALGKVRTDFRAKHKIDQDAYSIFLAPGNEKNEVAWCMENLRKGVKEFLLKYSAPTSLSPKALPLDKFVTVLSLHEGSEGEKFVKEYLAEHEWTGKLVIVTNSKNEHYDAMAASDFGFVYDGQMASSASALHLPINCLINMRMHQQWWNDYYNRWWNDMNIIADYPLNKELIGGEAWWGKFCEQLAENYVRPGARYEMIQKSDGWVQDAMSFKPLDRSTVRTKDLMLDDGQAYD